MLEHINVLSSNLLDGFEQELLKATLANLTDKQNILRVNNFSYSARELIRILLHRLSPDEKIKKCSWFPSSQGDKEKVTRSHRICYALYGGLERDYIKKNFSLNIETTIECLKDQIDTLSKYTHIDQDTFNIDDRENVIALEVFSSLSNFFGTLEKCKIEISDFLVEYIDKAIIDMTLVETIDAIDIIATHYSIKAIYTEDVSISTIDNEKIYIAAVGYVDVELQWGSNSDIKNDIGALAEDSFSFVANLECHIDSMDKIELIDFVVDTERWDDDMTSNIEYTD